MQDYCLAANPDADTAIKSVVEALTAIIKRPRLPGAPLSNVAAASLPAPSHLDQSAAVAEVPTAETRYVLGFGVKWDGILNYDPDCYYYY